MNTLTDSPLNADDGIRRIYGVVLASVTNNKDPSNLGRVQLSFPWLSGQELSAWARVATPLAGERFGFYCLPEVGDEVLVMFERGDMNHPFVVGSLWHERARPPGSNEDGKNCLRLFKSRSGHVVQLDDSDGKEQIVLRDKSGKNEVVIDTASNTIAVTSEKDITISAKGKVSLAAKGDVAIECDNFCIEAKSKVQINAQKDAAIVCGNFTVDAKQAASIKAKQEIGIDCMAGVKINSDGLVVT